MEILTLIGALMIVGALLNSLRSLQNALRFLVPEIKNEGEYIYA